MTGIISKALLVAMPLLACAVRAEDDVKFAGYEDEPVLPLVTPENRTKAVRALKRCDRRAKSLGISLNRGRMEKLKGDRLFKVLESYDKFLEILEKLPEGFVKACRVGSVWFSDEIVDMDGNVAAGVASGAGIELPLTFAEGVVYHEMFHKFDGNQLSQADRKEWDECNPEEFIYTGSKWSSFGGGFKDKRQRERYQKRLAAGKEKTAAQRLEEAQSKKDRKRIAENNANPSVQAAFINTYAQTAPGEDRAEVFRCMLEEGPKFLERVRRSEHMRRKMELMMRLTGGKKIMGKDFWDARVDPARSAEMSEYDAVDTVNWRSEPPDKAGFDAVRLAAIPRLLRKLDMGTTGLMVVAGGKVVYEYGDVAETSDVSSISPSIVSMLYGKYVAQYKIDLDETLEDAGLDDVGGLLLRERRATVRDVISCRSGCFRRAADDDGKTEPSRPRGSVLPGSEFVYGKWNFNVAAALFEKKTGMSVFAAFEKDFVGPLGLQDWNRHSQSIIAGDASVSQHPGYSFCLSTRDMARLGEVMLRKGRWCGMRILPESWVDESTGRVSKFKSGGGYGYMWWIENEEQEPGAYAGAFSARGLWGQRITVMPALDLVVAHKSSRGKLHPTKGSDYRTLLRLIVSAKRSQPS